MKYHAGSQGFPLCGTKSTGHRWCVVVLPPKEWRDMNPAHRCDKCVAAIKRRNAKRAQA